MAKHLYSTRNRGPLRTLPGGMVITRAVKREPINLNGLTREEIVQRTSARPGSKFLETWPLPRVTDWIEREVWRRGWQFPPGLRERVAERLPEPVGTVNGRVVHAIAIVAADRYVHACPWEDR